MSRPSHVQAPNPDVAASVLAHAARGNPVHPLHTPTAEGESGCRRDCGRDVGKRPRTLRGLSDAATGPVILRLTTGDARVAGIIASARFDLNPRHSARLAPDNLDGVATLTTTGRALRAHVTARISELDAVPR